MATEVVPIRTTERKSGLFSGGYCRHRARQAISNENQESGPCARCMRRGGSGRWRREMRAKELLKRGSIVESVNKRVMVGARRSALIGSGEVGRMLNESVTLDVSTRKLLMQGKRAA